MLPYMWLDLQKVVLYTQLQILILEIPFWNIQIVIFQECTEQLVCMSPLIYSNPRSFSGCTLQLIASWNAHYFRKFISQGSQYHKHSYRGGGWGCLGAMKWQELPIQKLLWPNGFNSGCFQLHISQNVARLMPMESHQPVLWWFPAGCLPGWASWSHLQTTRVPVDARQACEWGLSKSRPLKLWQWYKHELLVYCFICQMTTKSETWNSACIRPH